MTFSKAVTNYLEGRGMFPDQANEVLTMIRESKASESMKGRWNNNVSDYPDVMLSVVLLSLENGK